MIFRLVFLGIRIRLCVMLIAIHRVFITNLYDLKWLLVNRRTGTFLNKNSLDLFAVGLKKNIVTPIPPTSTKPPNKRKKRKYSTLILDELLKVT